MRRVANSVPGDLMSHDLEDVISRWLLLQVKFQRTSRMVMPYAKMSDCVVSMPLSRQSSGASHLWEFETLRNKRISTP